MSSQEVWTEQRIQVLREQENLPFVRADSAGIVQEINHRFREIYGWRDDELIGESLGLILPPKLSRFPSRRICTVQADGGFQGLKSPFKTGNVLQRWSSYR